MSIALASALDFRDLRLARQTVGRSGAAERFYYVVGAMLFNSLCALLTFM